MRKIIGIVIASMMFANIGFAEIKVIESKIIKDRNFYNEPVATVCVDGYKFVVWGVQGTGMVQFYEIAGDSGRPAKC